MHLSRRHQFPHGVTRRLSEAKDRIDSLSLDERCVFRLVELVLVSSLIGGWYASGGIESKPRRVATKVGILGSAFAVIWITMESSENESSQAAPSKIDENRAPSPWGWARLGLAVSAVVALFVGSLYFSRFIRRKALAFIRAHITESRPWTVYGVLVSVVCFALSFNEDKRTAKLDARLNALRARA